MRVQVSANYQVFNGLNVAMSERWRSGMRFQADRSLVEVGSVASVAYTNFDLAYDLPTRFGKTTMFINIQNLFDQAPPTAATVAGNGGGVGGGSGSGWAIGDDVIGRYFTFGVRARF